jgi:hypothetical protein
MVELSPDVFSEQAGRPLIIDRPRTAANIRRPQIVVRARRKFVPHDANLVRAEAAGL